MKKLMLVVLVFVSFQVGSLAQAALKDTMQAIGATFQILGRQFRDPSQNPSSAQLAVQLKDLFTVSLNEVPASLASLPPDQLTVALAQYKTLIQQEVDLSVQLEQAFIANDNARAGEILRQILDIQARGHGAFKP